MNKDAEYEFIERIDCNFPYTDRNQCVALIDEAAGISANALFSVIEEICRITPVDKLKVSVEFLDELLLYAYERLNHPLSEMILETAQQMIRGLEFSVEEVIARMETVRNYPKQYAALSILYFACDDKEGRVEFIWNGIVNEWRKDDYDC